MKNNPKCVGNDYPPQPARDVPVRQNRILRLPEVRHLTGLSKSTIDRNERDGNFPARRRLSANIVGWLADDIEEWVSGNWAAHARPRQSDN